MKILIKTISGDYINYDYIQNIYLSSHLSSGYQKYTENWEEDLEYLVFAKIISDYPSYSIEKDKKNIWNETRKLGTVCLFGGTKEDRDLWMELFDEELNNLSYVKGTSRAITVIDIGKKLGQLDLDKKE